MTPVIRGVPPVYSKFLSRASDAETHMDLGGHNLPAVCTRIISSTSPPLRILLVLVDLELGKDVMDLAQVLLLRIDGGRISLVGEVARCLQDRREPFVVG